MKRLVRRGIGLRRFKEVKEGKEVEEVKEVGGGMERETPREEGFVKGASCCGGGFMLLFLIFGIFVMWFLAFYMGFSQPISSRKIEKTFKKHFN